MKNLHYIKSGNHGKPLSEELNSEQLSCIEDCHAWFLETVLKHNITWYQTERKVGLSGYGIEEAEGTADVIAGSEKRTLHII